METLEQLRKELTEWTVKQVEAHNALTKLLPPVSNLTANEPLIPWMPTPESLNEFDRRYKAEIEAQQKCREIIVKICELRDRGKRF